MDTLNQLRERISELQSERASINALRRSREQVQATVDRWLSTAEAQGKAALQLAVDRAQAGQALAPCQVHGNAAVYQSPGAAPFSIDLGPLLVALVGKAAIHKRLSTLVDDLPDGLAPTAREQRLTAIDAELLRLETEEEARIVEMEQAGEPVLRRPDARPEIVLA
jgi:Flp pilus assembly protein TadB